jgi:hypothetical protein
MLGGKRQSGLAWQGGRPVLELWGSTAAVRYADGRVVVSPLSAEDDKSLDAALGDLHRVMLGLTDEGEGVLLLHLRSPEFPVGGAPNLRCPVSVHVGPDGLIGKVHAQCEAEPGCVLEMASAAFRGGTGLVVATTTPLLFRLGPDACITQRS